MESTIAESVQHKGLDFWKEFVDEVLVKAEELKKKFSKSIDDRIVVSPTAEARSQTYPYHQYAIAVTRNSTKFGPESSERYFYYTPGTEVIRMCAREEREIFIHIHTAPQGILAGLNGCFMTARQLASSVVEEMCERVKFPE